MIGEFPMALGNGRMVQTTDMMICSSSTTALLDLDSSWSSLYRRQRSHTTGLACVLLCLSSHAGCLTRPRLSARRSRDTTFPHLAPVRTKTRTSPDSCASFAGIFRMANNSTIATTFETDNRIMQAASAVGQSSPFGASIATIWAREPGKLGPCLQCLSGRRIL